MDQTPAKILVIDDDSMMSNLIASLLRQKNFHVAVSNDPQVGLKMALQTGPDVIILDRMMPGMDGLALLKELRRNPNGEKIPVLMLTNDDELATAQKAFADGADAYLIKPFDPSLLQQKIQQLLLTRRS